MRQLKKILSIFVLICSSAIAYEDPDTFYYEPDDCCCYEDSCCTSSFWSFLASGYWFPNEPTLFKPLAADPRQICYSAGYRFDDQVLNKDIIDVSFGDTLAFYEWYNVGPCRGKLLLEVIGALWAVFSPRQESAPLINADYCGGAQLTYAIPDWQFRLRGYHISSHIGDEFLLMHPKFHRKNPSNEYIDLFASYDFNEDIRYYAGVGYIIRQDDSFKVSPFYAEGGMEVRLRSAFAVDARDQLYGTPLFAVNFRYSSDFKHHVDATYVLGYEWGQLYGMERRIRVFLEYHDGYSVEGQFRKFPTNYFSIRTSYGF